MLIVLVSYSISRCLILFWNDKNSIQEVFTKNSNKVIKTEAISKHRSPTVLVTAVQFVLFFPANWWFGLTHIRCIHWLIVLISKGSQPIGIIFFKDEIKTLDWGVVRGRMSFLLSFQFQVPYCNFQLTLKRCSHFWTHF